MGGWLARCGLIACEWLYVCLYACAAVRVSMSVLFFACVRIYMNECGYSCTKAHLYVYKLPVHKYRHKHICVHRGMRVTPAVYVPADI